MQTAVSPVITQRLGISEMLVTIWAGAAMAGAGRCPVGAEY